MRLIDADEVQKIINHIRGKYVNRQPKPNQLFWDTIRYIEKKVRSIPTVEAKEVVHGYVKTVVGEMGVMHQECSACGNVLEWKAYPNYCDECGAKLDGADMRTSAE